MACSASHTLYRWLGQASSRKHVKEAVLWIHHLTQSLIHWFRRKMMLPLKPSLSCSQLVSGIRTDNMCALADRRGQKQACVRPHQKRVLKLRLSVFVLTQWCAFMTTEISMTPPWVKSRRIGQSLFGVLYTLSPSFPP